MKELVNAPLPLHQIEEEEKLEHYNSSSIPKQRYNNKTRIMVSGTSLVADENSMVEQHSHITLDG